MSKIFINIKVVTILIFSSILSSCISLKYSDYGRPFDFLKIDNNFRKLNKEMTLLNFHESFKIKIDSSENLVEFENASSNCNEKILKIDSNFLSKSEIIFDKLEIEELNIIRDFKSNSKLKKDFLEKIVIKSSFRSSQSSNVNDSNFFNYFKGNEISRMTNDPHPALIILLCFSLTPLAVYFIEGGIYSKFWINILLLLLAIACGVFLGGAFWLVICYPIFHALFTLLFG